jgi:hypothetical protein
MHGNAYSSQESFVGCCHATALKSSSVMSHLRSCSSGKGHPYHLCVPLLPHKLENVIPIIDIDNRCCDQRPRLLLALSKTHHAPRPDGISVTKVESTSPQEDTLDEPESRMVNPNGVLADGAD